MIKKIMISSLVVINFACQNTGSNYIIYKENYDNNQPRRILKISKDSLFFVDTYFSSNGDTTSVYRFFEKKGRVTYFSNDEKMIENDCSFSYSKDRKKPFQFDFYEKGYRNVFIKGKLINLSYVDGYYINGYSLDISSNGKLIKISKYLNDTLNGYSYFFDKNEINNIVNYAIYRNDSLLMKTDLQHKVE